MKTNQTLNVTVENGHAVFTTSDGKQNRVAILPSDSILKTVWIVLFDFHCDPELEVLIHYNGSTYRWNMTFAHYTFAKSRMSEADFANSILVQSNEEEA